MKTSGLSRYALLVGCIAIASCSETTQLSPARYAPSVSSVHKHSKNSPAYSVLYSFEAPPDGNNPAAGLIDVSGTLYGTTNEGGAYSCGRSTCGTVFSITTGGKEAVLHSFGSGSDGSFPGDGLVDVNGTLYGTTEQGGAYEYRGTGEGTVFSITTGGTEKVLHSFGNGKDGHHPYAGLLNVKGTLYGTTYEGGLYVCGAYANCGTVFGITTDGTEKVLHNFGSGTDGRFPEAGLLDVKGTLYGTTDSGGAYGGGTFFSITTGR